MLRLVLLFFIFNTLITTAQKGSKEKIYSSFTIINDGLEATRTQLAKETNKLYFDLIKSKSDDSTTVKLSDSIRLKSNELINYINHVKILLIIKTEKLDKEASSLEHDSKAEYKAICVQKQQEAESIKKQIQSSFEAQCAFMKQQKNSENTIFYQQKVSEKYQG